MSLARLVIAAITVRGAARALFARESASPASSAAVGAPLSTGEFLVLIGAGASRSSVRPRALQPGGRNRLNRHRFQCLVTWRRETSDKVRPGAGQIESDVCSLWRR
jgi:hypothetical protein